MRSNRFFGLLICLISLTAVSGCGGQDTPDLASDVTGRVLLKGQPVPEAIVVFEPRNGRPSTGITDAEGNFVLYYSPSYKGAIPGEHRVRISKMEEEAGDELIPSQYNAESTLTEQVTKEGTNAFTFDLK